MLENLLTAAVHCTSVLNDLPTLPAVGGMHTRLSPSRPTGTLRSTHGSSTRTTNTYMWRPTYSPPLIGYTPTVQMECKAGSGAEQTKLITQYSRVSVLGDSASVKGDLCNKKPTSTLHALYLGRSHPDTGTTIHTFNIDLWSFPKFRRIRCGRG